MQPSETAVVMGSGQKPDAFDSAALVADGIALAGRRSGGGAVFIEPSQMVWIDVLVSKNDSLWHRELSETFRRVGRCWLDAMADLGIDGTLVESVATQSQASRIACWAGLGWGEVVVAPTVAGSRGAAKIVGLSQRRTKWGARIQGMAVLDDSPRRIVDYLAVNGADARSIREAIGSIGDVAQSLGSAPAPLEAAVITRLQQSLST